MTPRALRAPPNTARARHAGADGALRRGCVRAGARAARRSERDQRQRLRDRAAHPQTATRGAWPPLVRLRERLLVPLPDGGAADLPLHGAGRASAQGLRFPRRDATELAHAVRRRARARARQPWPEPRARAPSPPAPAPGTRGSSSFKDFELVLGDLRAAAERGVQGDDDLGQVHDTPLP